ncbi:phosphopyruvate hydratase [Halorarum salinum]|uniref:Enolase n=1 Tax=Halorarum salinum TaxID=2743089 RepID=A0A7D5QAF9_9EURY|nr:phosphopyruvate hydratase [Halobaculum salinum]QLG61718.1 phosphopyruvate hydratase [Halobaculum salinum]
MNDAVITDVSAREILDNRLEPTLRVTVETGAGTGRADVPCGRSRGANEAVDLRDGGDRYRGLGVRTAVGNVEERIAPELIGTDVTDQRAIDDRLVSLDGTPDRSNLGGNALTGVSVAVLVAGAATLDAPLYRYLGGVDASALPVPLFDLIEGGELGASGLDFQEHQVVPTGADSFSEAVRRCSEVYHELGGLIESEFGPASLDVGDEGGYTPTGLTDPRDAFDLELRAVEECGYGGEFSLAVDVAASELYDPDTGTYDVMDERMTRGELVDLYGDLVDGYPLVSIEDPLHEEDFDGFAQLTDALDVQIVGDDLFVTSPDRVQTGIERGAANALLLKVNQVGTVSEALAAASRSRRNGYAVQVSERSGQTADTWLADLAVGLNAGQIKTGVSRSERTEQYNRLLEIEAELGSAATYGVDAGPCLTDRA